MKPRASLGRSLGSFALPQVYFNLGDVAQPAPWWEGAAGAFLALAAGGVLVTALALAGLEFLAARRRKAAAGAARLALYARLHRAVELTHGWIEHAADPARPRPLWIGLSDASPPSPELAAQVALLGPREVYEAAVFLQTYAGDMAVLAARAGGPVAGTGVVGFDLHDQALREALLDTLRRVHARARRAQGVLGHQIKLAHPKDKALAGMVDSHAARDHRRHVPDPEREADRDAE